MEEVTRTNHTTLHAHQTNGQRGATARPTCQQPSQASTRKILNIHPHQSDCLGQETQAGETHAHRHNSATNQDQTFAPTISPTVGRAKENGGNTCNTSSLLGFRFSVSIQVGKVGFCYSKLLHGPNLVKTPPFRRRFPRRSELGATGRTWDNLQAGSASQGLAMWEILDRCGNDPSAGSPTETLLRLHLPLNDKV